MSSAAAGNSGGSGGGGAKQSSTGLRSAMASLNPFGKSKGQSKNERGTSLGRTGGSGGGRGSGAGGAGGETVPRSYGLNGDGITRPSSERGVISGGDERLVKVGKSRRWVVSPSSRGGVGVPVIFSWLFSILHNTFCSLGRILGRNMFFGHCTWYSHGACELQAVS